MLDRTFNAVFDGLNEQYKPELEAVRVQYPFQDLRYRCPCLRFKYAEAMALLREQGPPKLRARLEGMTDEAAKKKLEARIESVANHADTEDIGTEDEKLLGEIVAEVHGQDFYIIDKFPSNVRPFYTMPDPVDPNFSNSYAFGTRLGPSARPAPPPHASSSPHSTLSTGTTSSSAARRSPRAPSGSTTRRCCWRAPRRWSRPSTSRRSRRTSTRSSTAPSPTPAAASGSSAS